MTTATLTLTEFLLARIAEDELLCRNTMGVPDWWTARVLAECEAKRRIVERYRKHGQPNTFLDLCDLAAVYADHPDCRAEWRA